MNNYWLIWARFVCGYSCYHEYFLSVGAKLIIEVMKWHFAALVLLIFCYIYFLSQYFQATILYFLVSSCFAQATCG